MKLSDMVPIRIAYMILNHIAIAVRCGCRGYCVNNIAVTIAVADGYLKP